MMSDRKYLVSVVLPFSLSWSRTPGLSRAWQPQRRRSGGWQASAAGRGSVARAHELLHRAQPRSVKSVQSPANEHAERPGV